MSTNPWKITSSFQTISTAKDEYMAVINNLKATASPEPKRGQKRPRTETAHLSLIKVLESRIETIDAEQLVSPLFFVELGIVIESEFNSAFRKCGGKSNKGSNCLHKLKFEKLEQGLGLGHRNQIMYITIILAR